MTPAGAAPGAADRVPRSHAQTRTTLRFALLFIVLAAIAATMSDARWLPLHLFLAGAIVLAISGVSLMLTVTWSAAPAPPDGWVTCQRACIVLGAGGITLGRTLDLPVAFLAAAGTTFLVGLLLQAGLLTVTIRRGAKRRFDVAVVAYVLALVLGAVGAALGVVLATAASSTTARDAHVAANLFGLVGLVVGGTMPFFAATVGRSRMSPHASARRLLLTTCFHAASLMLVLAALAVDATTLVGAGLAAYAVGIVLVLSSLPVVTRRQLQWAGPRLVALWLGGVWWAVAVIMTAVDVAHDHVVFGGRWLWVLVIAGYAQILWGSLAYLLPMLRGGGPDRLSEGFATTRSWLGLAAVNATGISLAVALPTAVTVSGLVVWLLDGAWRAGRVGTVPVPRSRPA